MLYDCRVFFDTGFNSINIPDSPSLLESMPYADAAMIDLNQERVLPQVRIRTDWGTVKQGDRCRIGTFYYTIDNIDMNEGDVATLTLIPDFVTSAGGVSNLEIIDGLTSRVHVSDDTFGLYTEDDPLMAPSFDMGILVDETSGDFTSSGSLVFLETTLDLFQLGQYDNSNNPQPALTAYDDSDTTKYVVWPEVPYRPAGGETNYSTILGGQLYNLQSTQGTSLYNLSDTSATYYPSITKGIARARALGIEQAMSGQFSIPSVFVTATMLNGGAVDRLSGNGGSKVCVGVPFVYGTARNNRIFYGSNTKYTLISSSGSSVSVNAETIYTGSENPRVRFSVDPRREGKPYFRFETMDGLSAANSKTEIFRNGVAGATWRSVPMTFTSKSGGILDRVNYDASRSMAELDLAQTTENYDVSQALNKLGVFTTGIAQAASGDLGGALGTVFNTGIRDYLNQVSMHQYNQKFAMQKANERRKFDISQRVNIPTTNFPISPDLMVEATNNGYIVTRSVYSNNDISRIDKILTAFGYKHVKVLEKSDFTNRQYFNYVEANVTVGGLPTWFADGVSAQISNGIRVWHVKPDHAYYTNNPIVGGA